MALSQKCQYALQAVLELAARDGQLTIISDIAAARGIPVRFLELILNELRQGGVVESRRGRYGGYALALAPADLTLGRVIRLMDGPLWPTACVAASNGQHCRQSCAFAAVWDRAQQSITDVYDTTTFQDILTRERAAASVPSYAI
ncbi:MAG: Rrf2 family transcriptional regulator [Planctomycetaceae bacterium]|nr:Rrf2 family transcriptional regulator [Planctomycetaceae bacterium]